MKIRARLFAGIAALSVAGLALAGCGGNKTATTDADTTSTEPVQITYLHRLPDGDNMTLVNDIVKKWNDAHPEIQVTATKFDGKASEMIKKLETDVKAENAPDLAQIGYGEVPEVFVKGLLEDVTAEAAQYKSNFAAGAYSLMTIAGKTYGLPQDTGPLVYYYNAAAFEELGIEVPTTQDELIESAKKAAEQGKYIMAYEPDEVGYMFSALAGASSPWYSLSGDSWKVNANNAGAQEVAKVYQALLDAKAATTNPRWDTSFDASLQDGSLIGTIGAGWEAPLIVSSAGDTGKGDWRVTQIGNWFGNGTKTGPDGGSGVAVMKGSKHKAEALEFLNWFNTQVADLTTQGLITAATTEAQKTADNLSEFFGGQDVMAEMLTANKNLAEFAYIPGFSTVGSAMTEAGAAAADGTGKVADIFTVAQEKSIETLKNLNLSVAE